VAGNRKTARSEPDAPETNRLNAPLSRDAAAAMDRLRARTGQNKVAIANRALTIYEYLDAEACAGNRILVVDPDGKSTEIRFL
jgi:hypothetical protein